MSELCYFKDTHPDKLYRQKIFYNPAIKVFKFTLKSRLN